jgi:hypothetical protein
MPDARVVEYLRTEMEYSLKLLLIFLDNTGVRRDVQQFSTCHGPLEALGLCYVVTELQEEPMGFVRRREANTFSSQRKMITVK